MKANKNLCKIEKNSVRMGDLAFDEFLETGGLEALKGSIRAYNTALRAIQHQLEYKSTKK